MTASYMIRASSERFESETEMIERLERAGVEIDRDFPPVPLDKEATAVLLRGKAAPEDVEQIGEKLGVEFFPEIGIGPA